MRHSNLDAVVYLGAFDSELLGRMLRTVRQALLVDFQARGSMSTQSCLTTSAAGKSRSTTWFPWDTKKSQLSSAMKTAV